MYRSLKMDFVFLFDTVSFQICASVRKFYFGKEQCRVLNNVGLKLRPDGSHFAGVGHIQGKIPRGERQSRPLRVEDTSALCP